MNFDDFTFFSIKSYILNNIGEKIFFARCPRAAVGLGHDLLAQGGAKILIYERILMISLQKLTRLTKYFEPHVIFED